MLRSPSERSGPGDEQPISTGRRARRRSEAAARRTIVCACHDVTLHDLRSAYDEGYRHPETLKRITSSFMGPCQGKYCAASFVAVLGQLAGAEAELPRRPAARPPLYTVRLGDLVVEPGTDRD